MQPDHDHHAPDHDHHAPDHDHHAPDHDHHAPDHDHHAPDHHDEPHHDEPHHDEPPTTSPPPTSPPTTTPSPIYPPLLPPFPHASVSYPNAAIVTFGANHYVFAGGRAFQASASELAAVQKVDPAKVVAAPGWDRRRRLRWPRAPA